MNAGLKACSTLADQGEGLKKQMGGDFAVTGDRIAPSESIRIGV
jgi:hypothetical protein